tara:strand:+ start:845 stop:2086 length:1242 start_codon:yes stop_codon:yes gene_type:complete
LINYYKNILTLSGGTLVSQIILILSVPFITRIFSPSDLGVAAFFIAIANILSVISTGKYDLAIFLPKNKIWVENLFFASIFINIILLIVIILVIIPVNIFLNFYFNYSLIWYCTIPCLFFLNGINTSLNALLNKKQLYSYISISRIIRDILLTFFTIFFGLLFSNPIFIILSHILSLSIINFLLIYISSKKNLFNFSKINFNRIIVLVKKYSDFPFLSMPSAFINILSSQAPIIMLSAYFGTSIAGMYSLVNRFMGAPSKLISSSTSEVFRQKATDEYNKNQNCKVLYLKTLKSLFILSLIPFFIIIIFGPQLFLFIFGEDWLQAGYYARYLSLFFIFQFCISPLGFTLIISKRQKYNFYWQLILLVLTNLGLFIGYYLGSPDFSIICFSCLYSIMYLFYFKESYNAAKGMAS